MTNTPLFHKGSLVGEEDYSDLSETYKIPYDLVAEVIAQIQVNGEPTWSSYTGTVRERVRAMVEAMNELPPEAVEPKPLTRDEEIVDHAATALIQAMMDPSNGSFLVNDEGICTINPAAPPTIENSYIAVHHVMKLRELGPKMDDKTSWMMGSMIDELSKYHGEDFEISQVCDQTTAAYNTMWTAVEVFRAFKNKRYKVSYTHHKEAFFQKIPDESKKLILHKAELYQLNSKDVRALGCIVRKMDDDQVVRNIRSNGQAKDLINAYKANNVTYLVYDDGEWKRISGTVESIPTGKVVIDLKNWTARANNGAPVDIEKVSPKKGK